VTPKTKRNFLKILPFGLIWLLFALVFMLIEYAAVGQQEDMHITSIRLDTQVFIFAVLSVTAVGLLVGFLELRYINKLFVKQSFLKTIGYKLLIYTGLLFTVIVILFPLAAGIELGVSPFSSQVWHKFYNYLNSITFLSTAVQLGVSLSASLFYAEISDHIGQGVLLNFFTGKYHTPKEEKRIFMFLDMHSSTSIAEKLGHVAYFKLLKNYYFDLSDAIVQHSGEVYQYVGDEIVISWPLPQGLSNNRCLHCFFAMKADLEKRSAWYLNKFGVQPTFKAALHVGKVTTGEIGALKKEIIFTGDVLNTTARIQALCHRYKTDLLFSEELLQALQPAMRPRVEALGEVSLRGKSKNINLYTYTNTTTVQQKALN
jgi:adenylate cyclase